MYFKTKYLSPLGKITLASDGQNLLGLWFEGQKHYGASLGQDLQEQDDLKVFTQAKKWLDRYLNGHKKDPLDLPLAPQGTDFQKQVWQILLQIPYGKVTTYGEIARKLAKQRGLKSMSAQAVGGAVGRNPLAIIIPCHRVVGTSGSLTGFASGLAVKTSLLDLEGVDTSEFFTPTKGTAL